MSITLSDLIARSTSQVVVTNQIIAKAVAKRAEQISEQSTEQVIQLMTQMQNHQQQNVVALREYRKRVRQHEKLVRGVQRSIAYFGETGNPLPYFKAVGDTHYAPRNFCTALNIPVPDSDDPAWNIPADWQPSQPDSVDPTAAE